MTRIVVWVAFRQVLISDPRPLIEEPTVAAPHDSVESRDREGPVGGGPHRFGLPASTERARHVTRRKTAHPPTPTITRLRSSRERNCSSGPRQVRARRPWDGSCGHHTVLAQHRSDVPPAVNAAQPDLSARDGAEEQIKAASSVSSS